jgi:hypothetical protein
MSDKKQELLTLREHQSSPQMFSAIRVVHLFSVGFFCLHPVSCVPGLSFLDFPSGSLTFVPSNRILTSTTVHSEKVNIVQLFHVLLLVVIMIAPV